MPLPENIIILFYWTAPQAEFFSIRQRHNIGWKGCQHLHLLFEDQKEYNGDNLAVLPCVQPEVGQLPHAFPVGMQAIHGGIALVQPGDVG